MLFAFKDCAGIPKSKSSAKPIIRNWPAFVTSNVLPYGYSELGGFGQNPHGNFPCGGSSAGLPLPSQPVFAMQPLALKPEEA